MGDKEGESTILKHMPLIEVELVASKKLTLRIFRNCKINEFHLQLKWYFYTSKDEEKMLNVVFRALQMGFDL